MKAVNEAGTNAIPTLFRMLRAHDSPFKARFYAFTGKQHLIRIPHVNPDWQNIGAVRGFAALGSQAAPAVPELMRMYDRESSLAAQERIAWALSGIGPDAKAAIPLLILKSKNADDSVRGIAYEALAENHFDPESVVPVFVKGLHDPFFYVRDKAAQGLGNFGLDAKAAVPALVDCIKTINLTPPPPLPGGATQVSTAQVRNAAIEALRKIDPEAAAKLTAELNETW